MSKGIISKKRLGHGYLPVFADKNSPGLCTANSDITGPLGLTMDYLLFQEDRREKYHILDAILQMVIINGSSY